jgi:hypothetical protein
MSEDVTYMVPALLRQMWQRLCAPIVFEAERQLKGLSRAEYGVLLLNSALLETTNLVQQQSAGMMRFVRSMQLEQQKAAVAEKRNQRKIITMEGKRGRGVR